MGLRSDDRKLSFEILRFSQLDDVIHAAREASFSQSNSDHRDAETVKGKRKKRRKKGKAIQEKSVISEDVIQDMSVINDDVSFSRTETVVMEDIVIPPDLDMEDNFSVRSAMVLQVSELRHRNVAHALNERNGGLVVAEAGNCRSDENTKPEETPSQTIISDKFAEMPLSLLKKDESLDWKKFTAGDFNEAQLVENSPLKFFMDEMCAGNSLRSTTALGNDKERERVYDTIFRLPWRCELLINFGLFVCVDSFLSLMTIMPTRIIITLLKLLKTRQFQRPSSAELSDYGCFMVMVIGVTLLQQADISLIYHMIRGQGVIKLYVVYNVLEIFDRLCQSFGGDVMKALFSSADGLAKTSPEDRNFWLWRFFSDEVLAVASSIIHSFILLAQAITLSTCIVAHNNALFAMLVSNNFAEIKSNVFKRYSKENVRSLVYFDSAERFHIIAFIIFVLAQNILEAEGPWFESFISNVLVVYICEVMIDIIKHSFIAKFNDIKPIVFSEYLEDLCKQTLRTQPEDEKKGLTFVPLAPACVVIRVLQPVYAVHLPCTPYSLRLLWIILMFSMTFVVLVSLKVMIGTGLRKFGRWYVKRCERRKLHSD